MKNIKALIENNSAEEVISILTESSDKVKGRVISFRDLGIKNLMDLNLVMKSLPKDIKWDQKGQNLKFDSKEDAQRAYDLIMN